ncbi:class I adenylate-forming enzyme family protein [Sphingopyxis sp. 550A]
MNPLGMLAPAAPGLRRLGDYLDLPPDEADAMLTGRARWDYRQLRGAVESCAAGLLDLGVAAGDRVAILSAPAPEFWISFLATARIGAVWLGLSPRSTADELSTLLADSSPSVVLLGESADPDVLPHGIRTVPFRAIEGQGPVPDVSEPDKPALVVFTSGSSGRRKPALISQSALVEGARRRISAWNHGPFRTLVNLPINHIGGVGDLAVTTLVSGGCLSFMSRFKADGTLARIARDRLTFWYQVPTMFELVLAADDPAAHDLSSLEAVCWSGAPASEALVARLDGLFPGRLGTDYSQTESVGAITLAPLGTPAELLAGSPGWPVPGRNVALSDAGEVLVGREACFLGYLGRSDSDDDTLRDGWLHTGDVGEWLPDGRLKLVGRLSDMFKSGGYNVYPREIEQVLEEHPGVARAAVAGLPDPLWGEVGHAWIEPQLGQLLDIDALSEQLAKRLAHYKLPKHFHIMEALPLLPVGKVDKRALVSSLSEALSVPASHR